MISKCRIRRWRTGFHGYGEYPNIQHNPKALEDVWGLPAISIPYYGTANTPIDECATSAALPASSNIPVKRFIARNNHDAAACPVTRRVCGYCSPRNR
ncbi:hypothetical protein KCP74_02160 [Salmonella enterica subsp. enterica]|nr:hypothetical protein KCP74_02160 [Salmonella enterica subsp. enterica]